MKTEGVLLCSQEYVTGLYLQPDELNIPPYAYYYYYYYYWLDIGRNSIISHSCDITVTHVAVVPAY
jgi:hypothetical protein